MSVVRRASAGALILAWLLAGCSAGGHAARQPAARVRPVAATQPSRWQVVAQLPRVLLRSVAAVSADDAWIVGQQAGPGTGPVVLNWTGKRWQPVRLPVGHHFVPIAVMASGPDNVWVAGLSQPGGPARLLDFDGSRWRTVPMPPGNWTTGPAAVVGPAGAWYAGGGCYRDRWPWDCRSVLAHWTGQRWQLTRLTFLVTGLAPVGGRIWVVGVTGRRPAHWHGVRSEQPGRVVISEQTAAGWQSRPAPGVRVGTGNCTFGPLLAAGSGGQAWLLCYGRSGSSSGVLYAWRGRDWQEISVPQAARGQPLMTDLEVSADGGAGVWLGPYAHWTGTRWDRVGPVSPHPATEAPGDIDLSGIAPIPGTSAAWAIGSVSTAAASGVIARTQPG